MKEKKVINAAKRIRKYCKKFRNCKDGCVFRNGRNTCTFSYCGLPDSWEFEEEKK